MTIDSASRTDHGLEDLLEAWHLFRHAAETGASEQTTLGRTGEQPATQAFLGSTLSPTFAIAVQMPQSAIASTDIAADAVSRTPPEIVESEISRIERLHVDLSAADDSITAASLATAIDEMLTRHSAEAVMSALGRLYVNQQVSVEFVSDALPWVARAVASSDRGAEGGPSMSDALRKDVLWRLLDLATDRQPAVRSSAALSLGLMGDRRAVEALMSAAAAERNDIVRRRMEKSAALLADSHAPPP